MKKIAVLITCYNRVQTTLECLHLLFKQKVPEGYAFDVWLVDDASPDKTGEKVKAAFPSVNVIQGTGSLFWSKGMRLAWDKAAESYDYDFYLWLNDDVRLTNTGAIATLIEDYESVAPHNEATVIVGSFTDNDNSDSISYGTACNGRIVPNGHPQQVGRGGTFAGNCVLVSRSCYEKIGPLCSGFHHGVGDSDYACLLHENHIPFYCASTLFGWCPANHTNFTFKGKNLAQRIALMFDPKGICVHDAWLFRMRHGGLFRAVVSFVHVCWIVLKGTQR